ncbi:hypothetical protein XENTR_v10019883 [Xenopus tropicalis]|nr:hypothetical protein XENTR_v10019883 [Xenopus tropicalis]
MLNPSKVRHFKQSNGANHQTSTSSRHFAQRLPAIWRFRSSLEPMEMRRLLSGNSDIASDLETIYHRGL